MAHGRWSDRIPAEQEHDPDRPERPEALAEEDDPDDDRQDRRRPAGDRVDERQVAPGIGARQEGEVDRLEDPRHEGERPGLGRDRRATDDQPADQPRRDEDGGADDHPPPRRPERVLGGLEQDVPAGVEDGRADEQGEHARGHQRPPPSAISLRIRRFVSTRVAAEPRPSRTSEPTHRPPVHEVGVGDHPGPAAGARLEGPAPLEPDAVADEERPEAALRACLEALDPDARPEQARAGAGPTGSRRLPASSSAAGPRRSSG